MVAEGVENAESKAGEVVCAKYEPEEVKGEVPWA